jgi:hypothetical protein
MLKSPAISPALYTQEQRLRRVKAELLGLTAAAYTVSWQKVRG